MPIPTRRLALLCAVASVAMIGLGNWAGFVGVNLSLIHISEPTRPY